MFSNRRHPMKPIVESDWLYTKSTQRCKTRVHSEGALCGEPANLKMSICIYPTAIWHYFMTLQWLFSSGLFLLCPSFEVSRTCHTHTTTLQKHTHTHSYCALSHVALKLFVVTKLNAKTFKLSSLQQQHMVFGIPSVLQYLHILYVLQI